MKKCLSRLASLSPAEQLRAGMVALLLGLVLGGLGGLPQTVFLGGIVLAGAFVFRKFWIGILAVLLLANAYAQWRHLHFLQQDQLFAHVGETVFLSGRVQSFPDVRENNTRVYVSVQNIPGRTLLILRTPADIEYGDRIHFTGTVRLPTNFGDFDYRKYLEQFRVRTLIRFPDSLEIVSRGGGNLILRAAKSARNFFEQNVKTSLPVPHSLVTVGVLLGVKNELPEWTERDFKQSGLTHLLVVSGTNVTIVMVVVGLLFRRFGRRAVWIGSLVALIFFVAMVGFDPPVLRAAVMGGIVGLSAVLGRFSDARNLVLLAAVILGLLSPGMLHGVSFLLSFAATLGIILLAPVLIALFSRVVWKPLALVLAVTVAAQIAVLPVLGGAFGEFPVAGFLANLVAEPLVPFLMAFGAVTMLTGAFGGLLAKIFAIPALMVGEALLWVAHIFGQIPTIPVPSLVSQVLGILFLLAAGWMLFSRRFSQKFLEVDFSESKSQKA
ncbi:MAG: ComEC family competence protein [Candidatus Gracilibacteria bacterium]|nr:ComEC family competence protein [Candidatus Gracilibacteria bacterium]